MSKIYGTFLLSIFLWGVGCSHTPHYVGFDQTGWTFDWPVDRATLTQEYRAHSSRPHYGLDLAAPSGTPVYSASAGQVVYVGSGYSGYGRLIIIEHGKEWATLYSHLLNYRVREGQRVHKGQLIGHIGQSGNASGPHLHFEARYNTQPVNPRKILPQVISSLDK